jgi:hypothetical protein
VGSWYVVIGITIRPWTERCRIQMEARVKDFPFSKISRVALRPTKAPV